MRCLYNRLAHGEKGVRPFGAAMLAMGGPEYVYSSIDRHQAAEVLRGWVNALDGKETRHEEVQR